MTKKAPGKAHRQGITIIELTDKIPNEKTAVEHFETMVWPTGTRFCPKCGCDETKPAPKSANQPYWCPACRRFFSAKVGTALENSNLPVRKWMFAIYLELTSLKGVSSMKLHRDIGVTQKTAWFMLHRIREAWIYQGPGLLNGPVIEADETYVGGKVGNMPLAKRKKLSGARGSSGKSIVAGVKDRSTKEVRATVVDAATAQNLQGFVQKHTSPNSKICTDESSAYKGLPREHEAVNHGAHEYVRGDVHTNGIEAFWSMLKRAHKGVYHKISPKHMDRYAKEFAGRHNIRELDTIDQIRSVVRSLCFKRLRYKDLIADNGLDSGARS